MPDRVPDGCDVPTGNGGGQIQPSLVRLWAFTNSERLASRRDYVAWARRCTRELAVAVSAVALLVACGPIQGYPVDPSDGDAVLHNLQSYFKPDWEVRYTSQTTEETRRGFRDEIVINRLRAYDIEFNRFEKRLWGDSNLVSMGGDLVALTLAGLGATAGDAVTKSALAAASAGVVGAQAAISKDLYYQRTLPALLAQIEANRDKVKLSILNGLGLPDAQYSLYRADLDLEALQSASALPSAIGGITEQAADQKATAAANLAKAEFLVPLVPVAVQDRKEALASYVQHLADSHAVEDLTKLDAIAAALGVAKGGTPSEERRNILSAIDQVPPNAAGMDALSAKLKGITQRGF